MAKQNNKHAKKSAEKVAEKMYDVQDYNSNNQVDKGTAITHEQVSDGYIEGTIDGKIDNINENDQLTSHDGEDIPRKGYE